MPAFCASLVASACAWADRGHKGNQRIPHGLLHGVFGGAVERHVVDDGPDDDATPHELPDGVGDVPVVSAEAVHQRTTKRVAFSENIEEPLPLRPVTKSGADAGHAVVGHNLVQSGSPRPRPGSADGRGSGRRC